MQIYWKQSIQFCCYLIADFKHAVPFILQKISQFSSNFLVWEFCEKAQFRIVSGESPETMRKLCISIKFPHQEISWNYGILRGFHIPFPYSRPVFQYIETSQLIGSMKSLTSISIGRSSHPCLDQVLFCEFLNTFFCAEHLYPVHPIYVLCHGDKQLFLWCVI